MPAKSIFPSPQGRAAQPRSPNQLRPPASSPSQPRPPASQLPTAAPSSHRNLPHCPAPACGSTTPRTSCSACKSALSPPRPMPIRPWLAYGQKDLRKCTAPGSTKSTGSLRANFSSSTKLRKKRPSCARQGLTTPLFDGYNKYQAFTSESSSAGVISRRIMTSNRQVFAVVFMRVFTLGSPPKLLSARHLNLY